jgi:signal transduction histidine kinase
LVIALVVLVGALLLLGSYFLRHLAEEFVASRLANDMEVLLAALSFEESGHPTLKTGRLNPVFQQPYSGHYYKIQTEKFTLRSRSLWDTDLTISPVKTNAATRYFSAGPHNQQLLVVARAFRVRGHRVDLAVTEDFTPLAAGLRQLTLTFVLIAGLLLVVLMLMQRLIVRRALRPLEDTRRDILLLERGAIPQLRRDAPIEVQPLVEEINRLVTVVEQRQHRSRNALGNLAHALKAPLTVLTQLIEHSKVMEQDELHAELGRQTQQIRSLMERELKRARIAGTANPGQRVVLAKEVADLVDTLRKIYREKGIAIQCQIPPNSFFSGDRDDLLELLGNLLDNACQWATSRVRLTAVEAQGWLRFTIEDDGPGCSPEQLEVLTRRGVRIDESRAGHGLGLAIVADIVEQYGGHLRLDRSAELGGFLAEVELPCLNVSVLGFTFPERGVVP